MILNVKEEEIHTDLCILCICENKCLDVHELHERSIGYVSGFISVISSLQQMFWLTAKKRDTSNWWIDNVWENQWFEYSSTFGL